MNRFSFLRPVLVLLVAVGILTLPDRASAKERAHHSRGTAVLDFSTGNFVGAGNATHLGHYTEVGHVVISGDNPAALHLEGWAIYTAANGDTLCATFTGHLNFFTGAITATLTYEGGCGRFDDASGSATLVGQFQADGTLAVTVEGTIDY